ncbi:MAG: exodeoxyribonuclease VII large subunit [Bacteroidota bacterium]
MSDKKILTVTELTRQIKGVLELGFTQVWIQGEISNFKLHSSGHLYFTLKDEQAQISAVMWKSRAGQLLFRPQDGMKVMIRGNITLYEPRGSYQIDCQQIQPLGKGELQIAFEQLKQRLLEEGLFDSEHKKPIPAYPQKIGIVTSPTGAAIRDMISVLTRRFPAVEVIFVAVKVQGIGAAEEIAQAVEDLNRQHLVDVMIVGRGGGSLEDLWAFNEEIVARAIFSSKIPVVSAVGHEIDFSICDFVADLRAPTPSAAAELVVKDKSEVVELIRNFCYTINNSVINTVHSHKQTIAHLTQSYSFNKPNDLIRQRSQQIDELHRRLEQNLVHNFQMTKQHSQTLSARINSLNPKSVLKRGYTIIRQENTVIAGLKEAKISKPGTIEFYDGIAEIEIIGKRK